MVYTPNPITKFTTNWWRPKNQESLEMCPARNVSPSFAVHWYAQRDRYIAPTTHQSHRVIPNITLHTERNKHRHHNPLVTINALQANGTVSRPSSPKSTAKQYPKEYHMAMRCKMILKQAYLLEWPEGAICVQRLDDSQVLQFTPGFAVRCVLHRCVSREIHC